MNSIEKIRMFVVVRGSHSHGNNEYWESATFGTLELAKAWIDAKLYPGVRNEYFVILREFTLKDGSWRVQTYLCGTEGSLEKISVVGRRYFELTCFVALQDQIIGVDSFTNRSEVTVDSPAGDVLP